MSKASFPEHVVMGKFLWVGTFRRGPQGTCRRDPMGTFRRDPPEHISAGVGNKKKTKSAKSSHPLTLYFRLLLGTYMNWPRGRFS